MERPRTASSSSPNLMCTGRLHSVESVLTEFCLRLRKLIDMGEGDRHAKKTHFDNLWKMVRYCENVHECRRALQLEYFGEVFDVEKCREARATTCDNCIAAANNSVEKIDITETAKELVKTVQRLNMRPTFQERNVTTNQLVEIWRGQDNAKLRNCGWKSDKLYGTGKAHNVLEANRMIKKLVMEGMLWEELVVSREGGASAYLRPGPKAGDLLQGRLPPVLHVILVKKTAGMSRDEEELKDPQVLLFERLRDYSLSLFIGTLQVVELQQNCFEELKTVILTTALSRGGVYRDVNQVSVDNSEAGFRVLRASYRVLINVIDFPLYPL